MASTASPAVINLVPHTHWDREWYEPFQRFRLRLVNLLDDVLTRAQADPSFRFTLDGQLAAVDDYLEVRPERTALVRELVQAGRLAIGPWEILLDEFCCAGETIVRNLERGLARAAELGGAMEIGYLPDMFGHCAQMPQILARAGLAQACVWRGVPAAIGWHAFRWEAPDGSAVRTEYLVAGGYGNAAQLLGDPDHLTERATALERTLRPWFGSAPLLGMYGTDHSAPLPGLMDLVARLDADDSPVRLNVTTLADHLTAAQLDATDGELPRWRGELRSHARANILPGVLSVRGYLKRALAAAERMVTRYAEPLDGLYGRDDNARFFDMAWRRLVACSCHDSVTGCGVDETATQVAARIAEAEQIGRAVRDRVAAEVAERVPAGDIAVFNPSPYPRCGLVWIEVPVDEGVAAVAAERTDGTTLPTQEVGRNTRSVDEFTVPAGDLEQAIRRRTFGSEMYGLQVHDYHCDIDTGEVVFRLGRRAPAAPYDLERAAFRLAAADRERNGPWRVRLVDEPRRTVLAHVPAATGLGWTTLHPAASDAAPSPARPVRLDPGTHTLDNGLVRVRVNPDGTLHVTGPDGTVLERVARLVDGGDAGDTYNYAPPAHDRLVAEPAQVRVAPRHGGPLLGSLEVTRTYRWPASSSPERRAGEERNVEVRSLVELRCDEPFVRLTVEFDNPCTDHRVRLHTGLARPAKTSAAEGQFAVVERSNNAEGGFGEEPIPTFPAYGFVDAGGAALLLDQVTEFELVDEAELAVTLLRGVGQISRSVHPLREQPAGPEIATPAAQCLGPTSTRLAVLPHGGGWTDAAVSEAAERFAHDLFPVAGRGDTSPPDVPVEANGGLSVTGNGVVLTSLRRRGDALEARLLARTHTHTAATIAPVRSAHRTDLLGRGEEPVPVTDGAARLELRPWEIVTVRLER